MRRTFDSNSVEDAVDMVETALASDDRADKVEALRAVKEAMKELADVAVRLVGDLDSFEQQRAESYWYAHIVGALDKEHGYCGGSMVTMESSIESCERSDDEEEED